LSTPWGVERNRSLDQRCMTWPKVDEQRGVVEMWPDSTGAVTGPQWRQCEPPEFPFIPSFKACDTASMSRKECRFLSKWEPSPDHDEDKGCDRRCSHAQSRIA